MSLLRAEILTVAYKALYHRPSCYISNHISNFPNFPPPSAIFSLQLCCPSVILKLLLCYAGHSPALSPLHLLFSLLRMLFPTGNYMWKLSYIPSLPTVLHSKITKDGFPEHHKVATFLPHNTCVHLLVFIFLYSMCCY